ncbi:hypothetical protein NC651_012600 [Populus alba x Populus x berolinensis]|nr:hypothetical protein NC651_012600 [Populus alba x Populus x berolinensis]
MGAGLRSPQVGDPTSKFVVEGAAQVAATVQIYCVSGKTLTDRCLLGIKMPEFAVARPTFSGELARPFSQTGTDSHGQISASRCPSAPWQGSPIFHHLGQSDREGAAAMKGGLDYFINFR